MNQLHKSYQIHSKTIVKNDTEPKPIKTSLKYIYKLHISMNEFLKLLSR